ncbi:MAG TPA: Hint domain-containing protein [Patescibacteria group bacterium]|nr:Hint domain-containing protein [Patescibacteria group bacterium]
MRTKTLILVLLFTVCVLMFTAKSVYGDVCTSTGRISCECGRCIIEVGQMGDGCSWSDCLCVGCEMSDGYCCPCSSCGAPCFTGETEINLGQEGERAGEQKGETKQIKDLKPGEIVSSFNPETGEIKEGTVSNVTKTIREGYYGLETESGKKVKVTGEHPFLAIKGENNQASSTKLQTTLDKFKDILSNTLTYRLITGLQAKVSEILK